MSSMKILALHGLGSSSQLLAEQLAPLMKRLGPGYKFHLFDGAITCGRGPGVPAWASGPFYSYAGGFSPSEMRDALNRIDQYITEHGPFDGVLGFSMGAAMAISYMLHQKNQDGLPSFSFGVFFSTIFIASPEESYCQEMFERWLGDDHAEFRSCFPDEDCLRLLESTAERELAGYLQLVLSMKVIGVDTVLPSTAASFLEASAVDRIPRLVHPHLLQYRIKIPTVHVNGRKDSPSIQRQSKVGRELCTTRNLRVYEHGGGHDIPFEKSDMDSICMHIMEMVEAGQYIRDLNDF